MTSTLNHSVYHVMKFIPYRRQGHSDSSSSSSTVQSEELDKESNSEIVSLDSSTDSDDIQHISTPSNRSSASSREELDKISQIENQNKEKM